MNNYEQQAQNFLDVTGSTLKVEFLKNDFHFAEDKDKRDIYKVTLKRGSRKYSFNFGQSLNNSGFYAQYGKNRYPIPYEKIKESDATIRQFVRWHLQSDFVAAKNDKIVKPIAPTAYDILACLQGYEVGSFEEFCNNFGYDTDSRRAKKTYKAVLKEYENLCNLYTDSELEQLNEIQ